MNNNHNMQHFIYIVNIGKEVMTDVLSHTLLLPLIDRKNVSFYFFKNGHNRSVSEKLNDIYIDVKNSVVPSTNQNFRIIYFNSDFNVLLNGDISEENPHTLLHHVQILEEHIKRFHKLEDSFCNFEHILMFHEPWFQLNQIEAHNALINNKVEPLVANINKRRLNRLLICRFTQIQSNPQQVAFDLMSLRSIKVIVELIVNDSGNICDNDDKFDKNGKYIRTKQISDFSADYDAYLPVYKGKLETYLDALNKMEPEISVNLFAEDTKFWSLKEKGKQEDKFVDIENFICGGKKYCLAEDYDKFEFNWRAFHENIQNETQRIIDEQVNLKYQFNPKENEINPTENPLKKVEGQGTLRQKLHKLLESYKEKIRHELSKQNSFDDVGITQSFKNQVVDILRNKKPEFKEILSKYPSNASISFLVIALIIATISPILAFLPLLRYDIPNFTAVLITMFIYSLVIYAVFMGLALAFRMYWNRKYQTLLKSIKTSLDRALGQFHKDMQPKEENDSLNRRVLYKRNYDILKAKEEEILKQEEILYQKKKIIESILDLGVLKNIEGKSGEDISITSPEKYFSDIEFRIKLD